MHILLAHLLIAFPGLVPRVRARRRQSRGRGGDLSFTRSGWQAQPKDRVPRVHPEKTPGSRAVPPVDDLLRRTEEIVSPTPILIPPARPGRDEVQTRRVCVPLLPPRQYQSRHNKLPARF
ncbi:hypothetical protein C8R47DRAFT_558375 [Mycena vitilis]|nr:hypothetical protein C8R47DRAFT_558375 [Mycena vitilis]